MQRRLGLEHEDDPDFETRWLQKLEQGQPPALLLKYASGDFRHLVAERWCQTRNPHLGEVLKKLGWTARYGDAERILTCLKAGLDPKRLQDAPHVARGLADPDPDVRASAQRLLHLPTWREAIYQACLEHPLPGEAVEAVARSGPTGPVLAWLAGLAAPSDGAELNRVLDRLPGPVRGELLARLRQGGHGHLLAETLGKPRPDELRAGLDAMRLSGTAHELFWHVLPHVPDRELEALFEREELDAFSFPAPEPLRDERSMRHPLANREWLVDVYPDRYVLEDWCSQAAEELTYRMPDVALIGDYLVHQRCWLSLGEFECWEGPRVLDLRARQERELEVLERARLHFAGHGSRASALYGNVLVTWDLATGRRLSQQTLFPPGPLLDLEPAGDRLLARWKHGLLWLDAETGEEGGRVTSPYEPWSCQANQRRLALGGPRNVRLYQFPSLEPGPEVLHKGLLGWSLRPDGSLLTANHSEVTHWSEEGELLSSWPQRRRGARLLFHPRSPALVALGDATLEWFHPGSERADQVLELTPGKHSARFLRDGELLAVEQEGCTRLWQVQSEIQLSQARPVDLERLQGSPALWARILSAVLRYRYRHEVGLGDFEFPDAITLD